MSAELSDEEAARSPRHHASRWWLLRDALLMLAGFAVVGALGGLGWEVWWTPPTGVVLDGTWFPDDQGVRDQFSGTGLFVIVGLVCGVLAGAACAWLVDRMELLTLAAVVAGSVLATWVMLQVGQALAPPDPQARAAEVADYTELPGTLEVTGSGAYAALPAGALTGLVVVFIGLSPTRRQPTTSSDDHPMRTHPDG